jgi:superfamily II helicase
VGVKGWTVVYRAPRIKTEIVAAMLAAKGLRVEVFGDNAYGAGLDFTDSRLMVPDGEAKTARELIEQAENRPV